jgi:uncharacterized SAM-binding protein YcdF (DUF218 family)
MATQRNVNHARLQPAAPFLWINYAFMAIKRWSCCRQPGQAGAAPQASPVIFSKPAITSLALAFLAAHPSAAQTTAPPPHGLDLSVPDLIVVLDGGSRRFERADAIHGQLLQESSAQEPLWLLIRCPRGQAPPRPIPELLQGYDTLTQMQALAAWLQQPGAPAPERLWIATDASHTPRAVLLARLALAGSGISVLPADPPMPPHPERLRLWRDGLRFALWRSTGLDADQLVPAVVQQKRAVCGLS